MLQRLLAVMTKEVRQLARDRLTFGMILGIPLLQILLFGYAINFDVRDIRAAVVDEAGTSHSRSLVADLQASGVVVFLDPSPGIADLRRRLAAGEISVGVVIPRDFERRRLDTDRAAVQILVDGAEPDDRRHRHAASRRRRCRRGTASSRAPGRRRSRC
jgi:ABC-2 type transport system permease protein